jgi:uncharacterized Zn finger protein (UPF0148 family)
MQAAEMALTTRGAQEKAKRASSRGLGPAATSETVDKSPAVGVPRDVKTARPSAGSYCRSCGKPLVVKSGVNRCMFCGRKKGFLQPAKIALTTRGAIKKANRAANRELNQAAKQIAKTYSSGAHDVSAGVMSWQEAEAVVRDWMKQNGYRDARLTKAGADGGVDVESSGALAQVKHHAKPVRLPEVQRIYGIAAAQRKKPMIFGSSGFTPAAREWANRHGVECYSFLPVCRVK